MIRSNRTHQTQSDSDNPAFNTPLAEQKPHRTESTYRFNEPKLETEQFGPRTYNSPVQYGPNSVTSSVNLGSSSVTDSVLAGSNSVSNSVQPLGSIRSRSRDLDLISYDRACNRTRIILTCIVTGSILSPLVLPMFNGGPIA